MLIRFSKLVAHVCRDTRLYYSRPDCHQRQTYPKPKTGVIGRQSEKPYAVNQ
ncbi:hypothetical protein ES703_40064 [subsurface metagenome]